MSRARSRERTKKRVGIALLIMTAGCGRTEPLPPLTAQVSGTLNVAGIGAPVRIVRDRWGVPHVYAESRDDAFFAQGLVQAQDRLFQMELWRRSAEGKLAEVLGANFIERDAMTRRLQYHGDLNAEWASYTADTRSMADAFVRGVNAWVALARERPPELFAVAGWPVVFWTSDDLLIRTDAFDREGTIAAAEDQGLPPAVIDSVRRAAAPAFFTGLAQPPRASSAEPPKAQPAATLPSPSPYFLIDLHTPSWNAAGAAIPWRPGIVNGHDETNAFDKREQRLAAAVRAAPLDPTSGRIVQDVIAVKGRTEPFVSTTQITPEGVVIATDRGGGRQFTLAWAGHERGTSPAFARIETDAPRRGKPDELRAGMLVVFGHPLAITNAARARFNISAIAPPDGGLPFFVRTDRNVWDASRAMNAPGQSEDPASEHFSDLAALWAAGQSITLAFSDGAVNANAAATLTLVPDRRR